tara:strand:- start:1506 stop:2270 length:765 start_codon:yes stop_codon:yes gene_type:complete
MTIKKNFTRPAQEHERENVHDNLFFLSSEHEAEKIVFFIDENSIVKSIIIKNNHDSHSSLLSEYQNKPFDKALAYLNLSNDIIFDLMEKTKKTLFEQREISDKNTKHKYMLSIACSNSTYVVIFTLTDKTNEALKAYISTIINNIPGVVYWKDKDGRYTGCNQFVADMAGFEKPENVIGKTDFDLCWNEFAQDWRNLDLEVMQEKKTIKREEQVKLSDGRTIIELTIKSPLYNDKNEVVGIIGTSLDITEQKTL